MSCCSRQMRSEYARIAAAGEWTNGLTAADRRAGVREARGPRSAIPPTAPAYPATPPVSTATSCGCEKDVKRTCRENSRTGASPNCFVRSSHTSHVQESSEMARLGIEPRTPRFSGTGNWRRKRQKRPANRGVDNCVCSAAIPVDCCSYPRLKDVAGPPRPFRLLHATAAWASKASATTAPTRAAPPRPTQV